MKTLMTKMLELASAPGFEKLPPAEQDRRFEELLPRASATASHG
jgi:hypothetical protein